MANNTKDLYKSLDEIKKFVPQDRWEIDFEDINSPISVIAIHGHCIEPGTTEVARYIAKLGQYKYFVFNALKLESQDETIDTALHITSNKFIDKDCQRIVCNSIGTVSVHGCDEKESLCYVGGKNFVHSQFIKYELKLAGFNVPDVIREGLEGYSQSNVCNRNMRGAGVQLELSEGLRKEMFGVNWKKLKEREMIYQTCFMPKSTACTNLRFDAFCKAIWRASQFYINS